MSFGRRLALFFVLLVIVPTMALISILLFVSEDSRRGKADARLAAGMETALALYDDRAAEGRAAARELATTPGIAADVAAGRAAALRSAASREVAAGDAVAVRILDAQGSEVATAGPADAIAFGEVTITAREGEVGTVRASTTTAMAYAGEVKRLTGRELVVSRDDAPMGATVTPPESLPSTGETVDLDLSEGEYRGRQQSLDPGTGEAVLLLGPRKEGGLLGIGRPAAILLAAFLLLAVGLSYALARALNALHEQVAALAVTDPLTGLWNRRRMGELLKREAERQKRFSRPYSFLIIDVDDFKSINDRFGHPQGDIVLERLVQAIEGETRSIDEAIRYGGDELALILSETDVEGAEALAERLREEFGQAVFPLRGGAELRTSVSIGIATAPECARGIEELVQAADQALLRAKRSGKNRIVVAPPLRRRSRA